MTELERLVSEATDVEGLVAEVTRLRDLIGRPYVGAWLDEVLVEAAHQRERWGAAHDVGKAPADWFWLVGYLAGKLLAAHCAGDLTKARHHTVSTAAALAHWAAQISGDESVMRPGLGADRLAQLGVELPPPASRLALGAADTFTALNFALDRLTDTEAATFLRDWREGAWAQWPEFMAYVAALDAGPAP
jgi:hypothetical protein